MKLSNTSNVPLSTLKLNTKILKDLGLIEFEIGRHVKLTQFGVWITKILSLGSEMKTKIDFKKKIPIDKTWEEMMKENRKIVKRTGLKESDVPRIIQKVRRERRKRLSSNQLS